jgi:hypothetical protein
MFASPTQLINAYEDYFDQQTEETLESLFEVIVDYGLEDFQQTMKECFSRRRPMLERPDIQMMRSGGSTLNQSRRYSFGPYTSKWISVVERHLKHGHGSWRKKVLLYSLPISPKDFTVYRPSDGFLPYDPMDTFFAEMDFVLPVNLEYQEFFTCIEKFFETADGDLECNAMPHIYLAILSNPRLKAIIESKCVVLNSTGTVPFFPQGKYWINDNLANWVSGVSFHVCENGGRHLLPTFYLAGDKAFSLINLKGSYGDASDYLKISSDRKRCGCGRPVLPFNFIGHCEKAITRLPKTEKRESWIGSVIEDCGLADRLRGWYYNIQFLQVERKVFVLRCSYADPPKEDEEEIAKVFEGLELEYLDNKILQVGIGKRPAFWATETMPLLLDWAVSPTVTSTRWLI